MAKTDIVRGKITLISLVMVLLIAISAAATLAVKVRNHPTSTYILDRQMRTITTDEVHGAGIYANTSTVEEDGRYIIHIVPITSVEYRDTIAFTTNGWVMEYGIVTGIDADENGDTILYIPKNDDSTEFFEITAAEFRGLVISR